MKPPMEETSFSTKSLIAAATPGKVAPSSCETKDLSDVQRRPTMLLLIVSYITCLTVRVLKPRYIVIWSVLLWVYAVKALQKSQNTLHSIANACSDNHILFSVCRSSLTTVCADSCTQICVVWVHNIAPIEIGTVPPVLYGIVLYFIGCSVMEVFASSRGHSAVWQHTNYLQVCIIEVLELRVPPYGLGPHMQRGDDLKPWLKRVAYSRTLFYQSIMLCKFAKTLLTLSSICYTTVTPKSAFRHLLFFFTQECLNRTCLAAVHWVFTP